MRASGDINNAEEVGLTSNSADRIRRPFGIARQGVIVRKILAGKIRATWIADQRKFIIFAANGDSSM